MFHNSQGIIALSKEPNATRFQKTLSVNDFYLGADDFDFPLGNIQAKHAVDFWLTTEDLPDPDNRVTLNDEKEIVLNYTFNNQEPTKRLKKKLGSLLGQLDMHPHLIPHTLYFGKTIDISGVGHQAGTVRFGTDPQSSVLDTDCKAHELDNLYVVDTSFFPSIGAVNPSLTAMANALRVGDHLLERLR
jgi:choline dehydrogenase-like flavoprotein